MALDKTKVSARKLACPLPIVVPNMTNEKYARSSEAFFGAQTAAHFMHIRATIAMRTTQD